MKKSNYVRYYFVILLISIFTTTGFAQTLDKKLDAVFQSHFKPNAPGATVLVAKEGKVLYRKAFGNANMELNIPMKPENVLELGSITKQFTAVAILKLMEENKLSLQDKLSKYIADYPKGNEITIHHLLTHTSGIKNYTDMQNFFSIAPIDKTPTELINVFKNEPMDFAPGEKFNYSNSGYIILGYIIEQVAKTSYEDYIENNIFKKLGMKNSYYGSKREIIPNRASGYQPYGENGFQNAPYLSMSLPYAAGSLMATVDDMLLWNEAIHNNTLISEKSKLLAFTNYTSNDGKPIYYGYGWMQNEIQGSQTLEHSGGIFGYTTFGLYAPKENLYVIVLTNSNGSDPSNSALEAAAIALGKPIQKQINTKITEDQLKQWVGTYVYDDETVRYVTFKEGSLYSQREGGQAFKISPLSETDFFFEESMTLLKFGKQNGKKTAVISNRIVKNHGVETDLAPKKEVAIIAVPSAVLATYVGTYELQPGFNVDITLNGNQLVAKATGQGAFDLFAESETTFFAKVTPLKIIFNKDATGKVTEFILEQSGAKMPAKKIK